MQIKSLIYYLMIKFKNDLSCTITCPRITGKQSHRNNYPYKTPKDYYRVSDFVPHLESIIQSIKEKFEKDNNIDFSL